MAISTYAELLAAVADQLARDDLTAAIPNFVVLTEAKINRDLYVPQMEQRATAIINTSNTEPEFISLPTDFQSMRRIRLSSVTGKPPLLFMASATMDEYRNSHQNVTGQPSYFTVFGTEIELCPTPDSNYTIEMVYRKNVPALVTNLTNWLLTDSPDIYLYGCLAESAMYTKDDERLLIWMGLYKKAMEALNTQGLTSVFNAGPLQVRVSGVTP